MSISVVIPAFNRRETLARCLDSVFSQTRLPEAVIVVDDGSSDGTNQWIQQNYPQVILIVQKNQGVSAARNAGIGKAETDWIAFLDSDDCWMPAKLQQQIRALEANPEFRVCHTEEKWIFKGEERPVAEAYRKQGGWIFEQCLSVCSLSPSTVLIHRSVFDEVGVFDETLPACEDYDLWLRITSRMPVLLVDEPLIEKHGGHEDQLSAQWGLDKWRIAALEKILAGGHLSERDREKAELQLREKCRIFTAGLERHGKVEEAEIYRILSRRNEGTED